ncbi:MAG TPA: glycosyltransferase family A protein [Thermoanaerobaculia bacterium]|nr:glycosyltransferase family A protein [Thermoanaerobaculia bacterium]
MTNPVERERVSVVIPLYQKAAHIRRALDSVLSQTFSRLEVIVVDDGSTDDGGQLVRQCGDNRVRLVRQPNGGAGAARNRGVAEATADLVAFLDADDEWETDFIASVLRVRRRFPEAAVFGTAYRLVLRGGEVRIPRFHGHLPEPADSGLIDYFAGKSGNSPLHSSSVMVEKDALISSGGFAEGVDLGEDLDTWIRLALHRRVAWSWYPAVTVHLDAENRSDSGLFHGNFPFFESVRCCQAARASEIPFPPELPGYLARRHMTLLAANWLTGDRSASWEIIRDCWVVRGARPRCLGWALLSLIPRPCVRALWLAWRAAAGRKPLAPQLRPISRASVRRPGTPQAGHDVRPRKGS